MYAAKAKRIIVVLLVLSVFAIATMMPACSSDPATAGMIAYGEGTVTTPSYRIWNGSAWESELSANDVGGVTNMVVLRSARTRDEKILGVLDKSGHINVQVWDGSAWGTVLEVTDAVVDFDYRGFDIAYEDSSGDAIIVYQNNANDPLYRVWNGTGWSDAVTLDLPTAGFPVWIRLKSKPGADEIIVATLDLDKDVTAAVWNGSAWGNNISLEGAAYTQNAANIKRCFAIAYESVSGDAMVAWSDEASQTDGGIQYKFWNGSAWGGEATVLSANQNTYEFIELGSDPLSNNIVMGAMDSQDIANVNVWDGSAWENNFVATNDAVKSGLGPADVEFESTSGKAMATYAVKNSNWLHYRNWSAGSDWSDESMGHTLVGGDPKSGDLRPDPNSDDMMITIIDGEKLTVAKWNGSAEGTPEVLETGVSSAFASFMFSYDRHFIISDVDAGGPYEAGDTISVTWNLTGSASAAEDHINVEYWDVTDGTQFDLTNHATSVNSSTSKALTGSEIGHEINVYVYTTSSSDGNNSTAITQGEPWPYSSLDLIDGPIITSCNSTGYEINSFAPGENVSVKGTGLAANTDYTIWIQFDKVNESDAIDADEDPSTTSPKNETVETDAEGNFSATLIWSIPTGAAVTNTPYDIVVDNLESGTVGTYNATDDGLDSASVAGIVAPVPDVSSLILFASGLMLAAVCFVRGGLKRDKRRGRS